MSNRITAPQRRVLQIVTSLSSYDVPHKTMLSLIRRGLIVLHDNPCAPILWRLTDEGHAALDTEPVRQRRNRTRGHRVPW